MSFKELLKKETVAIISAAAALISCMFVPVTDYVKYIDTDLIGILFCLMAVVGGLSENNVFRKLSVSVIRTAKNTRLLAFSLVFTVFFISMLITNDVALIAFVPFTVMLYEKIDRSPVYVIVLETIAANMGGAFTPFGNPQNLLLFSVSKMKATEFFSITLPITLISFAMLVIAVMFIKKEDISIADDENIKLQRPRYIALYAILFVLCILSVFKVINIIYVLASVCVVVAILQPSVFAKVDYGLLVTFACFFIFVGNLKNIPEVSKFIITALNGHEYECSLALSQIISNVPAAVMLSGFTDNYKALILGADIGGLGTLIASLASLITYKSYINSEGAQAKKFLGVFTLMNVIFLAVLGIFAKLFIL
ncbi:MAG: SLC13 family permease [Oscillospiraceae bacterium]|nr:SLC13 family permease [Oscillospiraceae bacterium]MDY3791149.1 SLC13 family permease [Oscillospiraceae bacterium]MDY6207276.1 SLC13 family permease [Oscillospiraceae bacterium]